MSSHLAELLALRDALSGGDSSDISEMFSGMSDRLSAVMNAPTTPFMSVEEFQKKLAATGPNSFTLEEFKGLLRTKQSGAVKALLEAGFRVNEKVLKAVVNSTSCELLLSTALEQEGSKFATLSPKIVNCASCIAVRQMIDAGLAVTPASLAMMASCKFWGCVDAVLAKSPAMGLLRHETDPVWFKIGYERAAKFIPIIELHQSTDAADCTYLMHCLNDNSLNIDGLPLSSNPAEGFDPNRAMNASGVCLNPLALAISTRCPAQQFTLVNQLLKGGADPGLELKKGTMLSHMAVVNMETIAALVEAGASFDKRGPEGDLPLTELDASHTKNYNRRTEVATAMVEFMDPAEFTTDDLKKIVSRGHSEIVTVVLRWLLAAGRADFIRDAELESGWVTENLAILAPASGTT